MIDIEAWVDDNLTRAQHSAGPNWTAECPACGRWGKFYVNVENGKWVCLSGKCGVRGRRIWSLVSLVWGVSPSQARAMMFREGVSFRRREYQPATLIERFQAMRGEVEADGLADKMEYPLPDGAVLVYDEGRKKPWRMPKYLKRRGIKRDTARQFGLAYTPPSVYVDVPGRKRPLYVGERIFIPIVCPNGYSWTARDLTGRQLPKYLNAPGADHSKLLFGWEHVNLHSDIALVEGELDTMMNTQHGIPTIGLGGKELSNEQLGLLCKKPAESAITLMLDPDAMAAAHRIATKLTVKFTRIFIAALPTGVDPGDATRDQAWAAMDDAQPFSGNRATGLVARLAGLAKGRA